jgi:hypothetical protein
LLSFLCDRISNTTRGASFCVWLIENRLWWIRFFPYWDPVRNYDSMSRISSYWILPRTHAFHHIDSDLL